MAILKEDFQNIPSSGEIPASMVPASSFAISFAFSYTATPSLDTFNKSFTGKIVVQVLNSAGGVKYEITIEEQYLVFVFGLAPGLVLYTWNWDPSYEKISGTIGTGDSAPPMTTLGEGTFGVDPAEGSGTSDGPVYIDSRFYSKIFTEPLDPGDKLKIKFHNLSAGYVVSRASLSLATETTASGEAWLTDARTGSRWHLFTETSNDSTSVKILRSRQFRSPLDSLHWEFGQGVSIGTAPGVVEENSRLSGLALMRFDGGLLVVMGALRDTPSYLRVFVSTDEGETWARVMNAPFNINPLAFCPLESSGRVLVYGATPDSKPAYAILAFGKVADASGTQT
ncbi:hypothetical protein EON80_21220, partial [bacterium]